MNYIQEINSFNDWLILNPSVSSDDIALWYALMNLNNISGWQKEFTVAISTIIDRTRLSRSAIYRSRNRLVQLGRIITKERPGNQCSIYQIVPFSVSPNGTQYGTQPGTQYGTQTGTQPGTINKLEETKQKKDTTSVVFKPPDLETVKDLFEKNNSPGAENFFDYYQSNGWKVGRNSMKDWHAAARKWMRTDQPKTANGNHTAPSKSSGKPGRSEINDQARANY